MNLPAGGLAGRVRVQDTSSQKAAPPPLCPHLPPAPPRRPSPPHILHTHTSTPLCLAPPQDQPPPAPLTVASECTPLSVRLLRLHLTLYRSPKLLSLIRPARSSLVNSLIRPARS